MPPPPVSCRRRAPRPPRAAARGRPVASVDLRDPAAATALVSDGRAAGPGGRPTGAEVWRPRRYPSARRRRRACAAASPAMAHHGATALRGVDRLAHMGRRPPDPRVAGPGAQARTAVARGPAVARTPGVRPPPPAGPGPRTRGGGSRLRGPKGPPPRDPGPAE